jgi:hypothetical protein
LPSSGKGFFVRVSLEEQGSQCWAQQALLLGVAPSAAFRTTTFRQVMLYQRFCFVAEFSLF